MEPSVCFLPMARCAAPGDLHFMMIRSCRGVHLLRLSPIAHPSVHGSHAANGRPGGLPNRSKPLLSPLSPHRARAGVFGLQPMTSAQYDPPAGGARASVRITLGT